LPLTLAGPDGRTVDIYPLSWGFYSQDIGLPGTSPFLIGGTWQLSLPPGGAIGPLRQTFYLPPLVHFANPESLTTIHRSADIPIAWTSSGYSAHDLINVELWNGGYTLTPGATAVAVACTALAQSGHLVLPASLLSQIGPTMRTDSPGVLQISVNPRPSSFTRFVTPVTGAADMPVLLTYSFADTLQVVIR